MLSMGMPANSTAAADSVASVAGSNQSAAHTASGCRMSLPMTTLRRRCGDRRAAGRPASRRSRTARPGWRRTQPGQWRWSRRRAGARPAPRNDARAYADDHRIFDQSAQRLQQYRSPLRAIMRLRQRERKRHDEQVLHQCRAPMRRSRQARTIAARWGSRRRRCSRRTCPLVCTPVRGAKLKTTIDPAKRSMNKAHAA